MRCHSPTHRKTYPCSSAVNLEYFVSFSESVHQLLDENQRYLSQLTSLLQDTTQEMEHSVMVWYVAMLPLQHLMEIQPVCLNSAQPCNFVQSQQVLI